jgi:phytoene dehydrogenase-like protein
MKTAVVIGAGIGGIAAALRLSKKGYQVTVFEANNYPGGKLSAFSLGDYRFDAGPSLFTMPHYVNELFELHNEKASDFFTYQKKKIACQYFWEDQTQVTAYADSKLFLEEIQNKLGVKAEVLEKYLKRAKKKFDLTAPLFLEQSLHKLNGFLNVKTLRALVNLSLYEINQNLHAVNAAQRTPFGPDVRPLCHLQWLFTLPNPRHHVTGTALGTRVWNFCARWWNGTDLPIPF